ncbi:DUF1145 domain-containing protein [Oceanisphaera psychrotolerans]|jgi:uncharacterized protein YhhL (DUF1145 family)|uniref:DUF1145 domain-containing protein n=1 Tax=Oceanisphaera psychrotolerans TaxID=1414654 RepID=A0A1J4QAD5_9GAMM|nr:DUF1145 domain-containing protein [Oceanisphaera psychrotolerans]OIN04782.1 hypothetical protein BFR47_05650 [Oceanisphaera psychrotolerans]
MKVLNLVMRLVMLVFWAGIIYALVGPEIAEVGSMPLILGAVVLFMHLLQMLMLKQVASVLHPTPKDYLAVLVFGSFAMHHHRARLKEMMEQKR